MGPLEGVEPNTESTHRDFESESEFARIAKSESDRRVVESKSESNC